MTGKFGKLEIWFNAFIPFHVPGYTRLLKAGEHCGRSAVPLPGIARLHPGNWHDWDSGFLTDHRGYSNDPKASVRMQSFATVAITPTGMFPTFRKMRTSGTIEVEMDTGKQVGKAKADLTSCVFEPAPKHYRPGFGTVVPSSRKHTMLVLCLKGAGSDPLVSASADIDYTGHFKIIHSDDGRVSVDFQGLVDEFPAFECYASWNGKTKTIFLAVPPHGNTVVDLLGPANRPVSGSAAWP